MEHSIFALEICARLDAQGALHHALREALPVQSSVMSPGEKWQHYHRLSALLLHNLHAAERGCWDYFDDDERAQNDFEMWSRGMTTAEGARGSALPLAATGHMPRYLTFTMAFLIERPSPSDSAIQNFCKVPEADLWRRDVFAHLLRNLGWLSFASVRADVAYLIPRDIDWALTPEDLTAEKFKYLRPLI